MTVARVEIERKFLIAQLPPDIERHPAEQIEQGYLAITDDVEVRVRSKGSRAFLTVKSIGSHMRTEEEVEIDARQLTALLDLAGTRRVSKCRYQVPHDANVIEVDVYAGRLEGLYVAEIEFDSLAESRAFAVPSWIGREVADNPAYANRELAVHGHPS